MLNKESHIARIFRQLNSQFGQTSTQIALQHCHENGHSDEYEFSYQRFLYDLTLYLDYSAIDKDSNHSTEEDIAEVIFTDATRDLRHNHSTQTVTPFSKDPVTLYYTDAIVP